MAATTIISAAAIDSAVGQTVDPAVRLRGAIGRRWPTGPDPLDAMCEYALAAPGKLFRSVLLLESAKPRVRWRLAPRPRISLTPLTRSIRTGWRASPRWA